MADERELNWKITPDIDTSSLDELAEKQQQAQEEAEKTSEALDKIGVNLDGIGTRAKSAFSGVQGASAQMGTSVRSAMLESIRSGDSLIRTLGKGIGAAVQTAGAKVKGFGAQVKSVAKDFGNAFLHPIQTIKSTLGHALASAGNEAEKAGKKGKEAGKRFEDMGKKGMSSGNGLIGVLKKVAAVAAGLMIFTTVARGIADFGKAAVNAAASAEETQSKFETVFKGAADSTDNWINNFSNAAKRSKNEIKGFMADAQALFTGIGMGIEPAAEMAKQVTSLSYDLASFHNLADQDAFDKLQSGLLGQTQGLKSMGIVLNDTALKQSMLSMGIKGTFDKLDEATKMQVRYNAILAQTKDAQTDVTRTSDSYTNSLKGVKGIWADFMGDAGAKFTPVLTKLFNTIAEKWPSIEPMLMGLVDVLAQGLQDAVPILLDLGETLLPIFIDGLSTVFTVLKPIIPVFGQLVKTLLPPLARIIGVLASTVLPPLVQLFTMLIDTVLIPLMPLIEQLAMQLMPVFAQIISTVAAVVMPLVQAFMPLVQAILPPLCQLFIMLANTILPPLIQIINMLFVILQPVFDVLGVLAQALLPIISALLPPIQAVLEAISPLLQAIAPVLEIIGFLVKGIVSVVGWLIIALVSGVEAANSFWDDIWQGANKSKQEIEGVNTAMGDLNGASVSVDTQVGSVTMPEVKPIEIPPPEPIDLSAYQSGVQSAMDTTPIMAEKSWNAATKTANDGLKDMGTNAKSEYDNMAMLAENAWNRMGIASQNGVSKVIQELKRLRDYADALGSINIGTSAGGGKPIPHNAGGTDDFEGGWTHINEEGGELAYLPGGTTIVPADKSDKLVSSSRSSSSRTVNMNVNVTVNGSLSEAEKRALIAEVKSAAYDAANQAMDDAADDEALQEAL